VRKFLTGVKEVVLKAERHSAMEHSVSASSDFAHCHDFNGLDNVFVDQKKAVFKNKNLRRTVLILSTRKD